MADAVVRAVGPRIVLGLPLGLGKACTIANALFDRAARDPSLHLTIFTALTLEAPHLRTDLERRFLGPVIARTMGGYPELSYAAALREGRLPSNIVVHEFFFLAGRWLGVPAAQQDYVSANYTHAARYLIERGVNVVAQLVAKRSESGAARFSLSCNADLTLDYLAARRAGAASFLLVGEVNAELPFMPGEGDLAADEFAHILDDGAGGYPLFAPPKEPVGLREHAIGLHVARLVQDGGTLQLGIGEESDATVHALILRQRDNERFRAAVEALSAGQTLLADEALSPFELGLYGVSEMFVDGFLALLREGILTREVDGALLHAAFFLGTRAFYRALREMPTAELARLQMSAVSFTNELGADPSKRAARVKARFVNSTMMVTLLGEAISDTLDDGRVVSGVGGQYNFVAQAFELPGARSILTLQSTRGLGREARSNIRWSYPHATIPRHLRDVFVSEYGIADVRAKSDAEVAARMIAIADSRFQPELLRSAKDARKVPSTYEIPSAYRENTPERISRALKPLLDEGLLPLFPLGTDFDTAELGLVSILERLQAAGPVTLARHALKGVAAGAPKPGEMEMLRRMGLGAPRTLQEHLLHALLRGSFTD